MKRVEEALTDEKKREEEKGIDEEEIKRRFNVEIQKYIKSQVKPKKDLPIFRLDELDSRSLYVLGSFFALLFLTYLYK